MSKNDPNKQPAGEASPIDRGEGWGWLHELRAIRNEPNQSRKLAMLREYEAKHGALSTRTKGTLGILGF